jgi:hypothetical protein
MAGAFERRNFAGYPGRKPNTAPPRIDGGTVFVMESAIIASPTSTVA